MGLAFQFGKMKMLSKQKMVDGKGTEPNTSSDKLDTYMWKERERLGNNVVLGIKSCQSQGPVF